MLKPIWIPYSEWECYKNGMYNSRLDTNIILQCELIFKSASLYTDMFNTLIMYENSAKVKCTNKMFNPISWVGQATCNRLIGATKSETCKAWFKLTIEERKIADNFADIAIKKYLEELENGEY